MVCPDSKSSSNIYTALTTAALQNVHNEDSDIVPVDNTALSDTLEIEPEESTDCRYARLMRDLRHRQTKRGRVLPGVAPEWGSCAHVIARIDVMRLLETRQEEWHGFSNCCEGAGKHFALGCRNGTVLLLGSLKATHTQTKTTDSITHADRDVYVLREAQVKERGAVTAMAFSHKCSRLCVGYKNGDCVVWDVNTCTVIADIPAPLPSIKHSQSRKLNVTSNGSRTKAIRKAVVSVEFVNEHSFVCLVGSPPALHHHTLKRSVLGQVTVRSQLLMTSKHGRHGLSVLLGTSLLPSNAFIGRRSHSPDTNHHSHSREATVPEHTGSTKQRNQTHTDTKPHTYSHTVIAGKRGEDTHTPSDTSGRGSTTETSAGKRTATHTHTHTHTHTRTNAHMNTNGAEADDRTGTGKTPAALLAVIATDKLVYIRLLPMARIVHTVSVAAALKGTPPLTAPQGLPRSRQGPKRRRTLSTYSTTSTTSTVSGTSASSTAGAQGVRGLQMQAEDTKGLGGAGDPGMKSPDTRSIYSTDSAMLGGEMELGARTHAQMQTPVYSNEYTNTSDRPQTHTHTHTHTHTQTVMSELHGLASEIAKKSLNELGVSAYAGAIAACASVAWLCASDPSPKGTRSHTHEQEHTPAHAYTDSTMIAYGWDNRAFVDALVGVSIDGERTGAPALNLERRAEYVLPCGLVSVVWLTRARLGVLDVNEHLHVLELGPRSTPLLLEILDLSQHSLTYHEIAFNAPVRSASHDRSAKNSDQSDRESMERHSAALEGPMGHISSAHTSPLRQSKESLDKSWDGGQLKSGMHKPWNGRYHTPSHSRIGTALIPNTDTDSNVYKQSYNTCVAEAGGLQLVGEQGRQQCTKTKAKSAATRRVRYRMYVNSMVWGSLDSNAETSGAPSERDEALESYIKRGNPKGKAADEDTVLCTLLGETSVLRVVSLSIKQQLHSLSKERRYDELLATALAFISSRDTSNSWGRQLELSQDTHVYSIEQLKALLCATLLAQVRSLPVNCDTSQAFRVSVSCVFYCLRIHHTAFLFSDVYAIFAKKGVRALAALHDVLVRAVLDGHIRSVSPWLSQALVAHLERRHAEGVRAEAVAASKYTNDNACITPQHSPTGRSHSFGRPATDLLEALALQLPIMDLDLNQCVGVCKRLHLDVAMTSLVSRGLHDYVSPVMDQWKRLMTTHQTPEARDKRLYRLLLFIHSALCGRPFYGQSAAEDVLQHGRHQLFVELFQRDTAHRILASLLALDSKQVFFLLSDAVQCLHQTPIDLNSYWAAQEENGCVPTPQEIISILRKVSLSKDTATETDTPDSLSNPTNHNASRNEAHANTLRDTPEHGNTHTTPNSTTAYGYQDRVCGGADSTGIHQGQVVGEVSEVTEGHMGAVDPDIQGLGQVVRLPACVRIHFHMFLGRMLLLTAAPPMVVLDVREFRDMLCSLCACDKRCMSRADVQTHTHTNTQTHTQTHTHPCTRTHRVGALQTYGDNEDESPVDISAGDYSNKNSVALSKGLSPDTELLPAPTATTGQRGGPGDCEPYTDAESVAATLDERQDIVMQLYTMGWCNSARVSDTQLLQWLVWGGLWQVAEVVYMQMGDLDKVLDCYRLDKQRQELLLEVIAKLWVTGVLGTVSKGRTNDAGNVDYSQVTILPDTSEGEDAERSTSPRWTIIEVEDSEGRLSTSPTVSVSHSERRSETNTSISYNGGEDVTTTTLPRHSPDGPDTPHSTHTHTHTQAYTDRQADKGERVEVEIDTDGEVGISTDTSSVYVHSGSYQAHATLPGSTTGTQTQAQGADNVGSNKIGRDIVGTPSTPATHIHTRALHIVAHATMVRAYVLRHCVVLLERKHRTAVLQLMMVTMEIPLDEIVLAVETYFADDEDVQRKESLLYGVYADVFSGSSGVYADEAKSRAMASAFAALYAQYVDLMCVRDPLAVYPFLRLMGEFHCMRACMEICRKRQVFDALAWLLERSGDYTGALALGEQVVGLRLKTLLHHTLPRDNPLATAADLWQNGALSGNGDGAWDPELGTEGLGRLTVEDKDRPLGGGGISLATHRNPPGMDGSDRTGGSRPDIDTDTDTAVLVARAQDGSALCSIFGMTLDLIRRATKTVADSKGVAARAPHTTPRSPTQTLGDTATATDTQPSSQTHAHGVHREDVVVGPPGEDVHVGERTMLHLIKLVMHGLARCDTVTEYKTKSRLRDTFDTLMELLVDAITDCPPVTMATVLQVTLRDASLGITHVVGLLQRVFQSYRGEVTKMEFACRSIVHDHHMMVRELVSARSRGITATRDECLLCDGLLWSRPRTNRKTIRSSTNRPPKLQKHPLRPRGTDSIPNAQTARMAEVGDSDTVSAALISRQSKAKRGQEGENTVTQTKSKTSSHIRNDDDDDGVDTDGALENNIVRRQSKAMPMSDTSDDTSDTSDHDSNFVLYRALKKQRSQSIKHSVVVFACRHGYHTTCLKRADPECTVYTEDDEYRNTSQPRHLHTHPLTMRMRGGVKSPKSALCALCADKRSIMSLRGVRIPAGEKFNSGMSSDVTNSESSIPGSNSNTNEFKGGTETLVTNAKEIMALRKQAARDKPLAQMKARYETETIGKMRQVALFERSAGEKTTARTSQPR